MYDNLLPALIICFCGIYAQVHGIECPQCTDPYDPASCTGRQSCLAQTCELHVHKHDRNRIEYKCAHGQSCSSHEAHGCGNNQDTCSYCCSNYNECVQELKNLFEDAVTTPDSNTTSDGNYYTATDFTYNTTEADAVTTPDSNTTSDGNYYTATDFTYNPTEADFVTITEDVEFLTSLTPEFPDVSTTAQTRNSCVQCGDFANNKPCTQIELIRNIASFCPEGLPYCFETVNLSGGNLQVIRGCAEVNFCRLEWDISHSKPGCYPLDFTAGNFSCTYCCIGDSCNSITPPADKDQVSFP